MSDTPAGGASPNVNALVEALDVRARQAGSEGAMTMLRGVLDTVSDTLASIELRLERLETHNGSDTTEPLVEAVQSSLVTFNTRLARLEEAFVQAVDDSGSGTQAVVDQLRAAVVETLAKHEPPPPAPAPPPAPPVDLTPLHNRLDGLAASVRQLSLDPLVARVAELDKRVQALADRPTPTPPPLPPPAPPVDLTPLHNRLDGLAASVRQLSLDPLVARVAELDKRVQALTDRPTPDPKVDLPDELLSRLDNVLTAGDGDDAREAADARLVSLVEERIASIARTIADRGDDTTRAIGGIREGHSSLERQIDATLDATRGAASSLSTTNAKLEELQRDVEVLAGSVTSLRAAVEAAGEDDDSEFDVVRAVDDAVRRESELLTQRVAALAVGVEATRALVEQLAHDAEASIGRKASEVGRRIAQDLGLRSRRSTGRRAPELGPGARP